MSPSLALLIVQAVESGYMPPWPPGPLSAPLVGQRTVLPEELALLRAWIANPILGDPAAYQPRPSTKKVNLPDPPDAALSMLSRRRRITSWPW